MINVVNEFNMDDAASTIDRIPDLRTMTTDELRAVLSKLGLSFPLNFDGSFNRSAAISSIVNWRQEQGKEDLPTRKCRVTFHKSGNPSSGSYVFASINGRNFQAPFGKEVVVPEYMLKECIDRAQTTEYTFVKNMQGQTEVVESHTPLYPFTLLGYVEEAPKVAAIDVNAVIEEVLEDYTRQPIAVTLPTPKKRGRPRKDAN